MAVAPGLSLQLGQRLALTPAMRQALSVLALPAGDLAELLRETAAANPFLELAPGRGGDQAWLAELPEAPPSLYVDLLRQLQANRLAPEVLRAATLIVSELREDGYLDATLAELAEESGIGLDLLQQGLEAVHGCEPPGIAARDLAECLALQLEARGHPRALARAICAHLDDFAEGRWGPLGAALQLERPRLEALAALLPSLPARPVTPRAEPAQVRIPDLLVQLLPDAPPRLVLNPEALPRVALALLDPRASAEMQRAHGEATHLLAALKARSHTLSRIAALLARVQAEHLASGGSAPVAPLSRQAAAAELGLHPSTLGRALRGKSLVLQGRILPLSAYFSHGLALPRSTISAHELQRRIHALIAAEPAGAPLADEAIRAQLEREGVDIARRTVAKYRQGMRIASSFGRRRKKATAGRPSGVSELKRP